jgi:tetratricopeptide (TPR) repeat protein
VEPSLFRGQFDLYELLRFEACSRRARIIVRGPSGVGKSYLLSAIGDHCAAQGKVVVIAAGEQGIVRPFQPFLRVTGPASARLRTKRFAIQGAEAAARSVPVVGSLVAFVTQAIMNDRSRTRRGKLRHLRSDEFEVLLHLESLVDDSDLLVIADNLQYWDNDSVSLLLDLLRQQFLVEDFPFVARIGCILGVTDGPEPANREAMQAILDSSDWRECRLSPIRRDEISAALLTFGGHGDIPSKELDGLYAITAGHLALLQQLALGFQGAKRTYGEAPSWSAIGESALDILAKVIALRINATDSPTGSLRAVLEAAAVIGESFSLPEIECLTNLRSPVLQEALRAAQKMQVLARHADRHAFTHEILRDSLLRMLGESGADWHGALAKCLAVIRPWDYRSRAEHLNAAGEYAAAARLFFANLFQRWRNEWPVSDSERNDVMARLSATGQSRTGNALLRAYTLTGRQALRLLESIENTEHAYFVAEKELMRACLIMGSTRRKDREEAVRILESALTLEHNEPEVDTRIRLALLSGYTHLGQRNEARQTEIQISQLLGKFRRFDPVCENVLYVHYRKAATVWGAETSADRCREAVTHFGPAGGSDLPRSPRQYFMALCNLSGNLLNCGLIEEALETAQNGVAVYNRFSSFGIVEPAKCINNLVVAGILIDKLSPSEGRQLLIDVVQTSTKESGSWIHRSNLAILAALDGKLDLAETELLAARSAQLEGDVSDPYHRYLIDANLAAVWHLLGRGQIGLDLWSELESAIPQVPDLDRVLWRARHTAQSCAFNEVEPGQVRQWFDFSQTRRPKEADADAWRFFGRGFVFSDSQIWTSN